MPCRGKADLAARGIAFSAASQTARKRKIPRRQIIRFLKSAGRKTPHVIASKSNRELRNWQAYCRRESSKEIVRDFVESDSTIAPMVFPRAPFSGREGDSMRTRPLPCLTAKTKKSGIAPERRESANQLNFRRSF